MNRIYKVVWSRARACYVVVSEYAKRTGKSASTKKLLIALAAAGIMAGGAVGMADAAVSASGDKVMMTEDDAKALNALIGKAATLAPTAAKKGESGSARITITDGGKAIPTDWTIDTTYATSGTAYAESSIHTSTGIAANDHSKMKTDSGYAAKQGTNNLSLGYYTNAGYGLAVEMEPEKDADGNVVKDKDGNEKLVAKKDKYGRVTYITEKTGNRRYAYQYDSDKQYNYATALGFYTAATNELATAWGWYSVASGCGSTAWGYYTVASGKYATAFGYKTTAMGENSLAIGEYSIASGKDSFAGGRGTKYYSTLASGDGAFAYGYLATASGEDSSALNKGNASGSSAAAFNKGVAKGDYSAAFNQSKASGENSVSFNNSTAEGESAAAFGGASTASGKYSLAAGYDTTASAKESVALGLSTKATKEAAFAGGQQSEANGVVSFAFGKIAKTGEYASSAISMGNQTEANGSASVALGDQSKAYGKSSLAIGVESIAEANYSNAIGGGRTIVEAEVDPDTGETVVDPDTGEVKYKYNATWSTAIGYDAKTYQAESMALGVYSRAYNEGSTALGYEAKAKVDYGTAIGAWSIADRDKYSVAYADNQKTPYGYDKREATDDETVWKSTGAAIAVGGTRTLYDDNDNVIGKETITRQITGVAAGTELTDAVNVAQLKAVAATAEDAATVAAQHTAVTVNGGTEAPAKEAYTSGNLQLKKTTKDGKDTYDVKLADDITLGDNGSDEFVTISGSKGTIWASRSIAAGNVIMDGDSGTVSGLSNTTTKYQGFADGSGKAATEEQLKEAVNQAKTDAAAADTHVKAGEYSADKDGKVSLDIVDKDGNSKGTVTITDVAKASDVGDVTKIKDDLKNYETDEQGNKTYTHTSVVDAVNNLDTKVDDISGRVDTLEQSAGKHSSVSAGDTNLTITTGENAAKGTDYKISLAKDLTVDSVDAGGVKIGKDGIDANGQKITNVADGTAAGDAVNYGQLSAVEKKVDNNTIAINNLSGSVNKLGNRINRVGAGAAALAALHPLDFDPEAKWDFAAGYGNYRGANAAAVGAFYRPNENWMLSLGGSFGGGENMVNAGVSLKVGAGSAHAGTSKAAMAKEIRDLKDVVADQSAEIEELKALVNSLIEANKAK